MPYYTKSYNPYSGVSNPLYTIPRVEEVNQKDAEIAFNEQEMETYARALDALGLLSDRNKEAQQRQAAMVGRNVRLNQDPNYQPGVGINQPITNVQEIGPMGFQPPKPLPPLSTMEVGPAGYQPGFQGGMDFASLQGMVPPPPDNKYGQSLLDGINQGSQKAKEQQGFFSQAKEQASSLLGGLGDALSSPFAQRILAIMARPEFQDPRGISAGIVGAAAGLKKDEATARKAMQERQLEYDKMQADLQKEAIKAGGDKKLTDTVYKTIEKTTAAKRGMEAINAYREILSSGPAGGVGGKFEKTIDRLAGLFNLGGGTTADRAQNIRQQILVDLEEALGRNNLNATEVKQALNVLSNPDTWTKSNQNLNRELDVVFRKLESIQNVGANTLNYFGYDPRAFVQRRPLHIGTRPSNR